MAPELYFKNTGYTSAVDLWSLGCAVVDAFNGSLPYDMEFRLHGESSAPLAHHQSMNRSPSITRAAVQYVSVMLYALCLYALESGKMLSLIQLAARHRSTELAPCC